MKILSFDLPGSRKFILLLSILALLTTVSLIHAKKKPTPVNNPTVMNIHAAYTAEVNAQTSYRAFARKADKEGNHQVASLFRALARAMKAQSDGHVLLLKKLGVKPNPNKTPPEVKTTAENLQGALNAETYISQTMFPAFAQQALLDDIKPAVMNFEGVGVADGEHIKLLQAMTDDPSNWKGKRENYYVCLVCGNVMKQLPSVCPICYAPDTKIKKMS